MQITVTATFPTQEQVDILANMKWYSDTIFWEPNLQSKEDFLRQVYEGIIIADATKEFVKNSQINKEAERIAEEQAIRDQVASTITSSI